MATGGAWILYFHDAPTIAREFLSGEAPFTAYFFFAILTLTTYIFCGLVARAGLHLYVPMAAHSGRLDR